MGDDDADATSSVPKNEKNIHDDNDISDSKEETSIIINNKIVKKGSTHKTLEAREGTTSVKDWDPTWGDKLQQEAQEGNKQSLHDWNVIARVKWEMLIKKFMIMQVSILR